MYKRQGQLLKVGYEQMALIDPKRPGPLIGPYPEYTDIMQKTMESTARSGASPEDALKKANEQMNAELEQYYG